MNMRMRVLEQRSNRLELMTGELVLKRRSHRTWAVKRVTSQMTFASCNVNPKSSRKLQMAYTHGSFLFSSPVERYLLQCQLAGIRGDACGLLNLLGFWPIRSCFSVSSTK